MVYVHILWCHNYPYHILVDIQACEIPTSTAERLSECVAKAHNKGDSRSRMWFGKEESTRVERIVGTWHGDMWWWISGFSCRDQRLQKEYASGRKENESKCISIYGCSCNYTWSTGSGWKVKYKQRFHAKVSREVKCMFCRMEFSSTEVQKKHIIHCHWAIFEDTVSISYTCCKFVYENVIPTVYWSAGLCGFFTYESMYLCDTCDIVHFSIL